MKVLFFCCMFFSSILLYAGVQKHLFVVSGVVINSNSSKKIEHFIEMLEKKSAYPLEVRYVRSYEQLSKILHDNPTALAWTCGAPYVEDSMEDGQQLVAVPLYKNLPTYRSFIVSRKDDKAKELCDFQSKIFAYSDPRSNSGFVAPAAELKKNGYDINTFFSTKIDTGIHERSIEAIYRGVADVGAIDEYVWDEYTKMHPYIQERLHVIEKIGPFAFTPIVAGRGVNTLTIEKLQKALVEMSADELGQLKADFNMDGFVLKEQNFYDSIKKNMLLIGIKLQK